MKLGKITDTGSAAPKRRYDDACGTAHGLELIGERWALLVLRELMLGPKRFGDLRADLPGISANVLTQRLEGLETSGLLVRKRLPPPASVQVYELTEWGYEAEPIVQELGRWAARSPLHDPTLPISGTSMMMSFRTMFDPARAGDLEATLGFRIGSESFVVRIADGRLDARRGDPAGADAVLTGTGPLVAAFVYGKAPLDALAPALSVQGETEVAERFAACFMLPPKAPAPT